MRGEFDAVDSNSPYLSESWFGTLEKEADFELSENMSLVKLRYVSSKLIKNNFIVAGMTQAVINSVVGTGITVRSKKKNLQKLIDKELSGIDKDDERSIQDFCELMINSAIEKGDVLINVTYDKNRQVSSFNGQKTKVFFELIEASRIRTRPIDLKNDNVREGVQYKNGRVSGYWVRNLTTNSNTLTLRDRDEDFVFIPKYKNGKRVSWLFNMPTNEKPDQSRTYPMFTPMMNLLRYFMDYLDTILIQARVSSTFSAFIHSKNPAGTKANLEQELQSPLKAVGKLKAGMIWHLSHSDSISFASPNRPSDNTDQFIRRLIRLMSMVIRYPYESLFLDLSEVNYTSFRSGQLEARRHNSRVQRKVEKVIKWIISWYIEETKALKLVPSDTSIDDFYVKLPQLDIVDEEKFAQAKNLELNKTQTVSRQMICDQQGTDYEQVVEDLFEEEVIKTQNDAEILKLKKEYENKYDIIFPDTVQEQVISENGKTGSRDTSKNRRAGEQQGKPLSDEDKKQRRQEDGNW